MGNSYFITLLLNYNRHSFIRGESVAGVKLYR